MYSESNTRNHEYDVNIKWALNVLVNKTKNSTVDEIDKCQSTSGKSIFIPACFGHYYKNL